LFLTLDLDPHVLQLIDLLLEQFGIVAVVSRVGNYVSQWDPEVLRMISNLGRPSRPGLTQLLSVIDEHIEHLAAERREPPLLNANGDRVIRLFQCAVIVLTFEDYNLALYRRCRFGGLWGLLNAARSAVRRNHEVCSLAQNGEIAHSFVER